MFLFLEVTIILVLGIIAYQDFKERMVWFWLYILFFIIFFLDSFFSNTYELKYVLINTVFLILQYVGVCIYYSLKKKKITFLLKDEIGLGDVLLLLTLCFCLPTLVFIFVYFCGLFLAIIWYVFQVLVKKKNITIPLAGIFAITLINLQIIKYLDCEKYLNLVNISVN
jgi:hypothetical protein